jgi:radical SAM superfamily enzyme YgiQ (UPF0313 family)
MKWSSVAAARSTLAHEEGAIIKDWGGKLPIALLYPNTYHVGMSSLALQSLYRLFNVEPDIVCERSFCGYRRLERAAMPLSLETQRPLPEFAILATTFSFELDYLNFVVLLRNAGIPALSSKRDESYPLLLAGGPAVSANPEPLAELCDAFLIGEIEEVLPRLIDALRDDITKSRNRLLESLAALPGFYVPALANMSRGQRVQIQRQWVRDLDQYPTNTNIFTPATEFGELFLAEIARGCRHGCRFCLAGCLYRPLRERSAAVLLEQARVGQQHRSKIGLVSAAVSEYSQVEELVSGLQHMGMRISVSSLRVDALPTPLLEALAASGTRTLTMAPEAGSERLRTAIRKGIQRPDILSAAEQASNYGFPELKLYFMVGLPGEEEEDVRAIVELVGEISRVFSRRIAVSVAPFVPKAHTPFEREAMAPTSILRDRLHYLRRRLHAMNVRFSGENVSWAHVQAALSRGDRQLGFVLASVQKPSPAGWQRALDHHGLSRESLVRARHADEQLPWGFVRVAPSAAS